MHYKNGMSSVSSATSGHVQHRILQDTVYGTHPIPGNYHLHLYFLFQANPASGERYGHFNFLKLPHEDTTTTVDQKRKCQKLISVKEPTLRHSTPGNVKAFWTKWSGCIATSSSSDPPLPPPCDPPDDMPQQSSGDQPTDVNPDSGEAMRVVLPGKCVDEEHEKKYQAEKTDNINTDPENMNTSAHTSLPEAPTATAGLIEHASSPSTEEAPAAEEIPVHKHNTAEGMPQQCCETLEVQACIQHHEGSPQEATTCIDSRSEVLETAAAETHAMPSPCEHQPEAPAATAGLIEHASSPSTEAAPAAEEIPVHKHNTAEDMPQQCCETLEVQACIQHHEGSPQEANTCIDSKSEVLAAATTTGLMKQASSSSTEAAGGTATTTEETDYEKAEAFVRRLQAFKQQQRDRINDASAPTATTGLMEQARNPRTEAAGGTATTTETEADYEKAAAFVRRLEAFKQQQRDRINDAFESEEEDTTSADEAPEPQGQDSQSIDDQQESMYQVWVVRLSGFECSMLFDGETSADMIMSWSAKKLLGTVYLMGSKPGCVVGTAVVKQQGPIKNFAALRATKWFTEASRDKREIWKNRLLQERKPLYLWKLEDIKKLESPKRVPIYGKASCRSFAVSFGQLTSFYERALPGLDLSETADYFRNLLSQTDLQKLHQTMKCLDGRVIRVGTTCSGTDIAVSVLRLTILSLAKHFGVTGRIFFCSNFSM